MADAVPGQSGDGTTQADSEFHSLINRLSVDIELTHRSYPQLGRYISHEASFSFSNVLFFTVALYNLVCSGRLDLSSYSSGLRRAILEQWGVGFDAESRRPILIVPASHAEDPNSLQDAATSLALAVHGRRSSLHDCHAIIDSTLEYQRLWSTAQIPMAEQEGTFSTTLQHSERVVVTPTAELATLGAGNDERPSNSYMQAEGDLACDDDETGRNHDSSSTYQREPLLQNLDLGEAGCDFDDVYDAGQFDEEAPPHDENVDMDNVDHNRSGFDSDRSVPTNRSPLSSPRTSRPNSQMATSAVDGRSVSAIHSDASTSTVGKNPVAVALREDLRCPQCIASRLSHCYVTRTLPGKKPPACLKCKHLAKRCDLSDEARAKVEDMKTPVSRVPSLKPILQDDNITLISETAKLPRPVPVKPTTNRRLPTAKSKSAGKVGKKRNGTASSTQLSANGSSAGNDAEEESLQDILTEIRQLVDNDDELQNESLDNALEAIEVFAQLNPFL